MVIWFFYNQSESQVRETGSQGVVVERRGCLV